MTVPFSIPANWRWASFADVARVASDLVSPLEYPNMPHIAPNRIESGTGCLLPYTTAAEDGVTSPKHLFKPGHIIYSKIRPYLAKVVHVNFDGICSADMYPVEAYIDSRYLFWWLLTPSFTELAAKHQSRVVLPKINKEALGRLPVPVPPLAEQHRIVAALEDHLSRLERGIAEVAKLAKRVDRLRGTLLGTACTGKPADHLSPGNAPDFSDWTAISLGKALLRIEAGKSFRCEARPARIDEWGIIKVSAMTYGAFREEENKAVAPGTLFDPASEIKPGDILLSRANTESYVGASVLVGECRSRLLLSDKSLRLIPSPLVDRRWLVHLLSSPGMRKEISRRATGTKDSMRNISQTSLRNIQIRVPSIVEQRKIAAILEEQLASLNHAEAVSDLALKKARSLRPSLLAEAFAGRLVKQDPADEPASVLLERIRAERVAQGPARRTRRSKSEMAPQKETLL